MGNLIVQRGGTFIGMARAAKIFINGEVKGQVPNNSEEVVELEPGNYKLKVGYGKLSGMAKEIDITIEEGKDTIVAFRTMNAILYSLILIFSMILGYCIFWGFYYGPESIGIIALIILGILQFFMSTRMLTLVIKN